MPDSTKLKLLKVLDILMDTDENHPMTANEIAGQLALEGVSAERKSVTRDIKCLIEHGYDIAVHSNNKLGYFLSKRTFDDWEIKVLMDAVNSCKFLCTSDAERLCDKLLTMQSKWSRDILADIVVIEPAARTKESRIKYAIDSIITAIKNNTQIEFKYYDLDVDGQYHSRKNGKFYQVSPYMLVWSNENYYLVANTFDYNNLSIYRLDRMKFLSPTDCPKRELASIEGYTGEHWLKEYIAKTFSMFVGNETEIRVICNHQAIGRIFDRFGTDIDIKKWDVDNVVITLSVVESEALYAYFMLYSREMTVVSPKHIAREVSSMLKDGLTNYNGQTERLYEK